MGVLDEVAGEAVDAASGDTKFNIPGYYLIAGGLALYYVSRTFDNPKVKLGGIIVSAGLVGFGIYKTFGKKGEFRQSVTYEAGPASQGPGATWKDKLIGLFGRITGNEPEEGATVQTDRPAVEGPFLGQPKNLLGIAGKIRDPLDGGRVSVPAFADTYAVSAAVENQSKKSQTGLVRARVTILENSFLPGSASKDAVQFVDGPTVTLAPGQFLDVDLRVPFLSEAPQELAIQFQGYTLDHSRISITRSLF